MVPATAPSFSQAQQVTSRVKNREEIREFQLSVTCFGLKHVSFIVYCGVSLKNLILCGVSE